MTDCPEEKRLWQALKKTSQRKLMYQILKEADKPMSAPDIYLAMCQKERGCSYAISTVYRTLLAFEEKGFIIKSSLPDSDTALYAWNNGIHEHYAICLSCHKQIPLGICPFQEVKESLISNGDFQVTGHKVELYGYCKSCSRK